MEDQLLMGQRDTESGVVPMEIGGFLMDSGVWTPPVF